MAAETPFEKAMALIRQIMDLLNQNDDKILTGTTAGDLLRRLEHVRAFMTQYSVMTSIEMKRAGYDEKTMADAAERLKNEDPMQKKLLGELEHLKTEIVMKQQELAKTLEQTKPKPAPAAKPKPQKTAIEKGKQKAIARRRRKFRGIGGEEGTIKL